MPELPDLEVFAHNLNQRLKGKKLQEIRAFKKTKINVALKELKKAAEGQTLREVYREGKELRLAFRNNTILGIHLMLRGKLFWFEDKNSHSHTLLELLFTGNNNLALTDYQANARITLNPAPAPAHDALSKYVNGKFLKSIMDSKAAVKNILLDQHLIRGIGNAYADEILWDAGISPFSAANKIPAAGILALAKSIKKVLKHAVKKISSTEPGIIGGEKRDFLLIHNSSKKASPSGAAIIKKMAGGRPTYFTGEQQLYK